MFFGRVPELAAIWQRALDAAFEVHAERFVRGRPLVRLPPAKVAINPIDPGAQPTTVDALLSASTTATSVTGVVTPQLPMPVLPGLNHHAGARTTAACS